MCKFILWLLISGLLWTTAPVQAQLLRNNVYGTVAEEEGGRLLALRNGGYLVFGQQQLTNQPGRLYLVRLTAQGDTLWSRRYSTPFDVFYAYEACENLSGQVLIAGIGFNANKPDPLDADALLLSLNAQGDTLWTKLSRGPTNDSYRQIVLAPDGNFVTAAFLNNQCQWLKLNAAGLSLLSTPLQYSPTDNGGAYYLSKATNGGYWVILGSDFYTNPSKLQYIAETGMLGMQKPFFPGDYLVSDLQPLLGGGYAFTVNGRLALYNAQMDSIWSRRLTSRNIVVGPRLVRETAQGNLLVLGQRVSNQQEDVSLVLVNRQGVQLHDTTLTRGAGLNSNEYGLGLALDPLTGNYVFSGYVPQGPIGGADLFVGILRRFNTVLGTTPAQQQPVLALEAWPNPLSQDELHLHAGQLLTGPLVLRDALGRMVRSWPATRAVVQPDGQTLDMAGVLAGVYLLTGTAPDGRRYVARVLRE